MKNTIIVFLLVLVGGSGFSQDIEVYNRYQDDKLVPPVVPVEMTFEEFQILSRDIRVMDMAAAMFFPGYISFKAEEPSAGYIAMGVRAAGYAVALYEVIKYNEDGFSDVVGNQFDRNLAYTAMGVIFASYAFDWIFGKTRLELKQEEIRYKYRHVLNQYQN